MKRLISAALVALASGCAAAGTQALIDNEWVRVWDLTAPLPPAEHDFINVPLSPAHLGSATFGHRGEIPGKAGTRSIVIELKARPAPPLANKSGYPDAYDRPHISKLLENDRVIVWAYRWTLNEPTPMHFHAKDVVVIYEEDSALQSRTPDGQTVLNEYRFADVRFNRRDRIHTETLVRGGGSAVIAELK